MRAAKTGRTVLLGFAGALAAALLVGGMSALRGNDPGQNADDWMHRWNYLEVVDQRLADYLLYWRARTRTRPPGARDFVIVDIDEESLTAIGKRWPWPRSLYARMIDLLSAGGARAIGFDLLFLEASEAADDEALLNAVRNSGKVVIAAKLGSIDRQLSVAEVALEGTRFVLPWVPLRQATRYGIVNLAVDTDQVIRRYRAGFTFDDGFEEKLYPHFTSALYEILHGHTPEIDPQREMLIDYLGPTGSFARISAADLLAGHYSADFFRQRIVLVGVSFADAHDAYATPLVKANNLMPGVEIHAHVLACLERGEFLGHVPRWFQVLLVLVLAALAGWAVIFRGWVGIAVTFIGSAVALLALALWLIRVGGWYLDLSYPLMVLPMTYIFASLPLRQRQVLETRVGPYRLFEELGRGGMAVVYRARHPGTGREVALKQMLSQYAADQEAIQRFMLEVETIKRLQHPNIVEIVDHGEVAGQPYYAMELVRGQSMEGLLAKQGPLTGSQVRQVFAPIARALAEAHRAGVIHRDLKPSNIMLTDTGAPKLMDFGIARTVDAPHLTQAGMMIGTPLYMSPEQCQAKEATAASDIYSLGITMYHLLAGKPPFHEGVMAQIIWRQIHEPPPDLRQVTQRADEQLLVLVHHCLAKAPGERPPSMAEVAKALDPFYTGA